MIFFWFFVFVFDILGWKFFLLLFVCVIILVLGYVGWGIVVDFVLLVLFLVLLEGVDWGIVVDFVFLVLFLVLLEGVLCFVKLLNVLFLEFLVVLRWIMILVCLKCLWIVSFILEYKYNREIIFVKRIRRSIFLKMSDFVLFVDFSLL